MERYPTSALADDIRRKIVLLTGPRQCGKTTLSLMLDRHHQYLNYDLAEHRLLIAEKIRRHHEPNQGRAQFDHMCLLMCSFTVSISTNGNTVIRSSNA